jgi:predicted nuclease of restriction endonuclease-like RecB superfamily
LERRCNFTLNKNLQDITQNQRNVLSLNLESSFILRKILFEESAKVGLALDYDQRYKILERTSSKLGITPEHLEKIIWLDRDDNLILDFFNKLTPEQLLELYNLSILQTMFFNCVNFEFSIQGGKEWKRILRKIKGFGLMYDLKYNYYGNSLLYSDDDIDYKNTLEQNAELNDLICSIDGPLSIFRLTNKYGVLMAKLIPEIIYSNKWNIKAWILKNNTVQRKLYEFNLSSNDKSFVNDLRDKNIFTSSNSNVSYNFDSKVEEKFFIQFNQLRTGWELIREPDPLILPKGNAFIVDFMFQRYGKQIYFEIVGYWTPDYLKRKLNKFNELLVSERKYDFLVAVNEDNLVANGINLKNLFSEFLRVIDKEKIIIYNKNSIPLKPIIKYLRLIDKNVIIQDSEIHHYQISNFIKNLVKQNIEIINLEEIAIKFSISISSVYTIVSNESNLLWRDKYILLNTLLISNNKIHTIKKQIDDNVNFNKLQQIFQKNKIPDFCHLELINFYGFEIIWKGLNSSDILLRKK